MTRFFLPICRNICLGLVSLAFLASAAHAQTTVSVIGPVIAGDCVAFNSTTIIKDAGVTCGSGGVGSPGGSNGQVQFNNAGSFGGLTNTQLTALVQPFTSSVSGVVPPSGGGTANFLRADGTFATPPGLAATAPVQSVFGRVGAVVATVGDYAAGQVNYTPISTTRTVGAKLSENLSVLDFGAKCDGTTDDTTAIQSALSNIAAGGTLLVPGLCKIIGSGSAILTRTTPINLVGTGMYTSGFIIDSTVPNTRDALLIQPAAATTTRGYSIYNMGITNNGGTPGRDSIVFDSTSSATTEMADVLLNHVFLQSAIAGGFAVHLHNSPGNTNGGLFNFTLTGSSVIVGGVIFDSIGDSIRIRDSIITGPNAAISGSQIAGAGNLLIEGNNISATGGGIVLQCSVGTRILHNEFEQQATSTEVNNAIIDLQATGCTSDHFSITENQVQSNASIGNPNLIRIGVNNTNVKVDSNRLATPAAYAGIVNASTTLLCGNNEFVTASPHVSGTAPVSTWSNGC